MIRPARPAAAAVLILALGVLATGLAGCITLFSKEKPVQLYMFGAAVQPPPAAPGAPFVVRVGALDFDQGAGGDRILTVTGDEAAYIDGARWVAPASELFEEALEHGFNTAGGRARLVPPGPARVDYRLSLQVSRFETRYASRGSPPTIVVHLHATLERQSDMAVMAEKEIDEEAPASADRVGAIVKAYDTAVGRTVSDLVSWLDATAHG